MNNYIKYFLVLAIVSVAAFCCHYFIGSAIGLSTQWAQSGYSLLGLYLLGFCCSLVITYVVLLINNVMPKNLGMFFLGAITLKAFAFYIYVHKGLEQPDNKFLKYNLILVFFVFLVYNVFVAFKALNGDASK